MGEEMKRREKESEGGSKEEWKEVMPVKYCIGWFRYNILNKCY